MPPDDCFCLQTWSRYHHKKQNKRCWNVETILIWRSSRKMNRNKNLLILYYLWKKLSKLQKKVFHAFSFQVCSTANSKFSSYISLCDINFIKIQTMSLVLSPSILAETFCVLFTSRHNSLATEKKVQGGWTFFESCERNKNIWSCTTTDTGRAKRSYLTVLGLSVS